MYQIRDLKGGKVGSVSHVTRHVLVTCKHVAARAVSEPVVFYDANDVQVSHADHLALKAALHTPLVEVDEEMYDVSLYRAPIVWNPTCKIPSSSVGATTLHVGEAWLGSKEGGGVIDLTPRSAMLGTAQYASENGDCGTPVYTRADGRHLVGVHLGKVPGNGGDVAVIGYIAPLAAMLQGPSHLAQYFRDNRGPGSDSEEWGEIVDEASCEKFLNDTGDLEVADFISESDSQSTVSNVSSYSKSSRKVTTSSFYWPGGFSNDMKLSGSLVADREETFNVNLVVGSTSVVVRVVGDKPSPASMKLVRALLKGRELDWYDLQETLKTNPYSEHTLKRWFNFDSAKDSTGLFGLDADDDDDEKFFADLRKKFVRQGPKNPPGGFKLTVPLAREEVEKQREDYLAVRGMACNPVELEFELATLAEYIVNVRDARPFGNEGEARRYVADKLASGIRQAALQTRAVTVHTLGLKPGTQRAYMFTDMDFAKTRYGVATDKSGAPVLTRRAVTDRWPRWDKLSKEPQCEGTVSDVQKLGDVRRKPNDLYERLLPLVPGMANYAYPSNSMLGRSFLVHCGLRTVPEVPSLASVTWGLYDEELMSELRTQQFPRCGFQEELSQSEYLAYADAAIKCLALKTPKQVAPEWLLSDGAVDDNALSAAIFAAMATVEPTSSNAHATFSRGEKGAILACPEAVRVVHDKVFATVLALLDLPPSEAVEMARSGEHTCMTSWSMAHLKMEPHKASKLAEGRARIIQGCDIVDEVLFEVVYGPYCRALVATKFAAYSAPGMGFTPDDNARLLRVFKRALEQCDLMSSDKSHNDWSVTLADCYAFGCMVDRCTGVPPGSRVAWGRLCVNGMIRMAFSRLLVGDRLWNLGFPGVNRSGWKTTIALNTFVTARNALMAQLFERVRGKGSRGAFYAVCNGDDSVATALVNAVDTHWSLGFRTTDVHVVPKGSKEGYLEFCSHEYHLDGRVVPLGAVKSLVALCHKERVTERDALVYREEYGSTPEWAACEGTFREMFPSLRQA